MAALVEPLSEKLDGPSAPERVSQGMLVLSAGLAGVVRNSFGSLASARRGDRDADVRGDPDVEKADGRSPVCQSGARSADDDPLNRRLSLGVGATADSDLGIWGYGPSKAESACRRRLHLLTLPPELLLMIVAYLDFADIERLRRTSKQLRALASPGQIRTLVGPGRLRTLLLGHCKTCLCHDPYRSHLLMATRSDPGYPLASCCIDCAVKTGDLRIQVGRKVHLANFDSVWVCRWCGWPVVEGASYSNEQFHRGCWKVYNDALCFFFVLGWVQLSLGMVGAVLVWVYFRHHLMALVPTIISCVLLWACLFLLLFRGNRIRTYHWTFLVELTILGLWIPPIVDIRHDLARLPVGTAVPTSTKAVLAFCALNMLFRLLNGLGNVVLFFKFDVTRRHRPKAPLWRRVTDPFAMAMVFWTYPQALEQKYPPNYD